MEKKQSNLLPLLALIFGIASLLTSFTVILGALCGLTSIILSIISLVKKKPVPMPIIGLICSFIGIVTSVFVLLIATTLTVSLSDNSIFNKAQEALKANQSIIDAEKEAQDKLNEILNEHLTTEANVLSNEITESNIVENTTTADISDDWKNGEFIFDGKKYKLFDQYYNFELAGWSFDMAKYGYDDSYVLNSKQKTYGTMDLENANYDADIWIGLVNDESTVSTIKQCAIWSFDVDNAYADKPVSFTLAKGIKNGSTLEEVQLAYGEPDSKYYSESLKYWEYTYNNDLEPQLRLTIYDDNSKGLTSFVYQHY